MEKSIAFYIEIVVFKVGMRPRSRGKTMKNICGHGLPIAFIWFYLKLRPLFVPLVSISSSKEIKSLSFQKGEVNFFFFFLLISNK